jgi:hypothetical protein
VYVSPQLRPLVRHLTGALPACRHPWGRALAFVLRSRLILSFPLPRKIAGLTNPVLPIVLMNRRWLAEQLPDAGALPRYRGRVIDEGCCEVVQVLLHECAHQLWAVWPEWKLWLRLLLSWPPALLRRPGLAWVNRVYGVGTNSADAVSEALARELCVTTRYSGQEICYRSPLGCLHPAFRRGLPPLASSTADEALAASEGSSGATP